MYYARIVPGRYTTSIYIFIYLNDSHLNPEDFDAPFRVRDGERVFAERFFRGGVKVAPTGARDWRRSRCGSNVPRGNDCTGGRVETLDAVTDIAGGNEDMCTIRGGF